MSGGKLFKESQVTDKIVEWIFMQFTLNLSQVTPTLEIILVGFWKLKNGYRGMCMSGKKLFKES